MLCLSKCFVDKFVVHKKDLTMLNEGDLISIKILTEDITWSDVFVFNNVYQFYSGSQFEERQF